jgi:hypothetical protein
LPDDPAGTYEGDFAPILMERADGELRLVFWPEIDDQDPVIQSMTGALASNSAFAVNQYKDGNCPDCGECIPGTATKGESCPNCGHVWAWGEPE